MCLCLGKENEHCVCRENDVWNAAIKQAMNVVRMMHGQVPNADMLVLEVSKLIEPTYQLANANTGGDL
jgi:hypothetical protein